VEEDLLFRLQHVGKKYLLPGLMFFTMYSHLMNAPYTKVEESFNIQAIHDLLYHQGDISKYDHFDFPGVVPRTFVGPLLVSAVAYPIARVQEVIPIPKIYLQFIVRLILGITVCVSLLKFADAISIANPAGLSQIMLVLLITQFHFFFYASRTLGNVFALVLVLNAFAAWFKEKNGEFIWWSAFAIVMFRFELAIFLGLLLLFRIYDRKISLFDLICHCAASGICSVLLTVAIDSYFWQRLIWPEGEVMYFNVILNKSSNWGTMPFFWYFYSVLPRALLSTVIFVPIGILSSNRDLRAFYVSALLFVLLFSFLPHKELRFIIYTFPVFNLAAASGILGLLNWVKKSIPAYKLCMAGICLSFIANTFATVIFASASRNNYPGGEAFRQLHELNIHKSDPAHVHICNAAAQTGVTRFGEIYSKWRYSKDESVVYNESTGNTLPFTHLIVEAPCTETDLYRVQAIIPGFDGVQRDRKAPFIHLKQKPMLCILEKQPMSVHAE